MTLLILESTGSGKDGVIFKIILLKASDHVVYPLESMDFGHKLILWIHECISSASFLLLVNRSPTLLFKALRGLTQCDCLLFCSPML